MVVPAFAGSIPAKASAKGSTVPVSTDVMTIKNSEVEMAKESSNPPSDTYTLANPAPVRQQSCVVQQNFAAQSP